MLKLSNKTNKTNPVEVLEAEGLGPKTPTGLVLFVFFDSFSILHIIVQNAETVKKKHNKANPVEVLEAEGVGSKTPTGLVLLVFLDSFSILYFMDWTDWFYWYSFRVLS